MSLSIVNLTLLDVSAEIENLSAFYPAQIQRKFLANPELRQKLLTYVLHRMNNHYIAQSQDNTPRLPAHILYCSTLEQLEIEELIQQGIYYLIKQQNVSNSLNKKKSLNST